MLIFILALIFQTHSETVTITGHPEYAPVVWQDADGKLHGTSVSLVRKALNNIGYTAQFLASDTWARAQKDVNSGRVDILLPPYRTPIREKTMVYSDKPLFMDKTVLFHKKGRVIKFKNFTDLKKYKGIAIRNDSFGKKFDDIDKKHKLLKRLSKSNQSFKFLILGRADYFVAGYNAGLVIASQMGIMDQLSVHEQVITEAGMFSPISKKSKFNNSKFKKLFFNELNRLKKSKGYLKEHDAIIKQFLKK